MRSRHQFIVRFLAALTIFATFLGIIRYAAYKHFPVISDVLTNPTYGRITMARPLISYQALAVIVMDTGKFNAKNLAKHLAGSGVAAAVFDSSRTIKALTDAKTRCLHSEQIIDLPAIVGKWAKAPKGTFTILSGIGEGALLPLVSAVANPNGASINLSVNFTVDVPKQTGVCQPFTMVSADGHRQLTSAPVLKGKWLAAWTDQPDDDTAIFVRGIKGAETDIAPYDTPLDTVASNEIQKIITRQQQSLANAVPTVALPADRPNSTVTFFYSGDGGWRDLDRDIGGIMAKQGYPVVGIDTLRYFWSSKKADRVAADLSSLMQQYRSAWKAKHFVLAGYSFGADILPAVYNHLPAKDKKDVKLLVLLALGKTADFEIHVSGWIEKNVGNLPILPELQQVPGKKILCIYGQEEKDDSACPELSDPKATIIELPGGHHFHHDYQKLTQRLIESITAFKPGKTAE